MGHGAEISVENSWVESTKGARWPQRRQHVKLPAPQYRRVKATSTAGYDSIVSGTIGDGAAVEWPLRCYGLRIGIRQRSIGVICPLVLIVLIGYGGTYFHSLIYLEVE